MSIEAAAQKVADAIRIPGSHPDYHYAVMNKVRASWPSLASALDELLVELDVEKAKNARELELDDDAISSWASHTVQCNSDFAHIPRDERNCAC